MNTTDPELRSQQIRMRRLEIAATLAEWRRAFYVDGVSRSIGDRATLEAEDAALALEARVISTAAVEAQIERRRRPRADTLAQLQALLLEEGRQDLVALAEARAGGGS